ncbi:hypothetical protein F66182_8437 [Fusarium sp. NRRL 66182]|nr:hypothetical protein F66182_8437 [Fusarium sp. NRRL 66182]
MSSQTIRLRLVVRRHSVPEVKLVWPCVLSEDLTVAKLLVQVNDVIPLESRDWGLEDYAVELPDGKGESFELLHFQPVGKVLKEDDQVLIRSLLTDDLRRRRLGGRHQISDDGRHLIDGIAFGRPWLKVPRDRPSIDLPPRKRARITYEEELDEDDNLDASRVALPDQLLLQDTAGPLTNEAGNVRPRVRFVDDEELDDDDDNSDFQPTSDTHEEPEVDDTDEDAESSDDGELDAELADELKLLQEDNVLVEQAPPVERESLLSGGDNANPEALLPPLYPFNLSLLDRITALRSAFPLTSISTIQAKMAQQNMDLRATFQALAKTNEPTVSFDVLMERALFGTNEPEEEVPSLFGVNSSQEESESPVLKLPGQPESTNPARPLIEEVDNEPLHWNVPPTRPNNDTAPGALISVVEEEEEDGTSSSGSSSESEFDLESKKGSDESSEMDSKSDGDSGSDSEDDNSDVDSESDSSDAGSAPTQHDESSKDKSSSEAEDSSSSDSDSGSNSEPSPSPNKAAEAVEDSAKSDSIDSSSSSSSSESGSDSDSDSEPEEVSSKAESQAKLSKLALAAKLPASSTEKQVVDSEPKPVEDGKAPGTGLTKTKKRNARRRDLKRIRAMQALEDTQSQPSTSEATNEELELLARKRALLSVVGDENEDVSSPRKNIPAKEVKPLIAEVQTKETSVPDTTQDTAPSTDSAPAQRRHKVDVGAGRRLLFGALGLKNPKSKADEEKLRNNLMKSVKPLQNPRIQTSDNVVNVAEATTEQTDEDPDAWRGNISYRAVECCHDDVVLSEPPFPFVQRWDPQQQYGAIKKRKRPSQNFYDDSYYDEDSRWNGEEGWDDNSQKKKSKKRKSKGGHHEQTPQDSYYETGGHDNTDVVLNYDDIPTKTRLEDSQFMDMDDLPSLPSDMSTLPSLEPSGTKAGMVITWKQLLLSKATNWQPEMVSMTGLVLSISEDNYLHVLLAKRDRDENQKEYDEHTGQRVYSKFEAPDLDEDNEEEDDGRREISWAEISDPRLVQQAPSSTLPETQAESTDLSAGKTKPVQNGSSTADNKVSDKTDPDETMAEELDTQRVRAEVEADLKGQEAVGKLPDKDKSTSIPSGQQPLRLEFAASGDNSLISSSVRPAETPSDMNNSPSLQLQETLQAAIIREKTPLSHGSEDDTKESRKVDKPVGGLDEATGAQHSSEETSWDVVVPDSIPSPELPPLPSKEDIPVDRRIAAVPSSVGSIRSGRQPPSVSGLEDLAGERVEDSVGEDIDTGIHERSASPHITNVSLKDSSPFPSLEEIFHTARQTQSPVKSTQPSVPRSLKPIREDVEYEEAMRKLDEGEEESDRSHDRNKSLRRLFPNATQPEPQEGSPLLDSFKSEGSKIRITEAGRAATPPPMSQKVKREAPFVIPEGRQVIELSSSPSSVQFTEDYAQDSEDETYEDSPLPQGSGWVQKNMGEMKTRSRGKSLPAVATKSKTTRARAQVAHGRTSLPPARDVTASAFSQIKGRRRSTRKF